MKKLLTLLLPCILIASLFTACGSSSDHISPEPRSESVTSNEKGINDSDAGDTEGSANSNTDLDLLADKKIILNANIHMETKDFDVALDNLTQSVKHNGGYISSSSQHGDNYSSKSGSIVVRIPADNYDAFIAQTGEIGNITYREESIEDVTFQYVDVEARLKTLTQEEAQLHVILETAADLEGIIAIEARLSEVRYEIESFDANKRLLDDLIDYSTIDIYLDEVKEITETDTSFVPRLLNTVKSSWYSFVNIIEEIFFALIFLLPLLVFVAICVLIILLCVKKSTKKSKAKRNKKTLPPVDTNL